MCLEMLTKNESDCTFSKPNTKSFKAFTSMVSRGALIKCSYTVFNIVCVAEKAFSIFLLNNSINKKLKFIILRIANEYLDYKGISFKHPIANEEGC